MIDVSPPSFAYESPPCEICGVDAPVPVATRPDLMLGGDTPYTMCRCGGCGVIYQHPRPTEAMIGRHYPSDTSYPSYRRDVAAEPMLRRLSRRYGLIKRCRLVLRHVRAGRLLDVGCATGDFLSEMRRQPGWSVVGAEPSLAAARYAAGRTGAPILRGLLNDAPFATGIFDAVTMWDVLEHVYRPREVIAEAARILRPGGALVVNHPNTECIDRRVFGEIWVGYDLPRHTYLYPPDLLRQLMGEYGLREVERICLYGSHSVLADNLTYLVERRLGRGGASQLIARALRSLPARLATTPYIAATDRLRRGGNIAAVFVRVP
ncbi:MAG: class I SAM-dependent methyltransferase [Chloroflexales bacterium]